jgi:rRNA maturation endonuclease Nob1
MPPFHHGRIIGSPQIVVIVVILAILILGIGIPRGGSNKQEFTRYCPKCGKGLSQPDDAPYCAYCGARLS